jgi:tetratricopeptide (TPR) repeat protein
MKEKPTVALTMIVKDEYKQVSQIINDAIDFFDEIILVVSDKPTANKLKKHAKEEGEHEIKVVWREWNDRFDEARNFAQSLVTSDYWFWIDADDKFNFTAIPQIVDVAVQSGFDQILLPYNYAQDEQGNCIAFHWRERLLRTEHPFVWKGWVHETPISDMPYKAHRVNAPVVHINSNEHTQESLERNHKILLEATVASDDPRYQLYLGTSYYSLKNYGEAVEILDKFIKVSGNVEDVYRALLCMSECAMKMGRSDSAMQYAMQAAAQIPEYPQAYRVMAQWEAAEGNWNEAVEWVKVAESKPQPTGLGVFDPSAKDEARIIATQAEFMLKNYNKSLKWCRMISENNPVRKDIEADILEEADVETFVTLLPKFRRYFASDAELYDALCYDLKYDLRLRGLRDVVVKPKTWADNSIVFLCGESFEEWGPHTLDKGMGGSEEAVIYLARELAKIGWEVTIYGAVEQSVWDGELSDEDATKLADRGYIAPRYVPWKEINKSDNFNVFVAWRAPEFAEHINAKVKVADIHDVLNKSSVKNYPDVTYFVKSNWHRNLYPELPDEKVRVIGNGIKKEQFV